MGTAAKGVAGGLMVGGVAFASSTVLFRPGTRANRALCHRIDGAAARLRYLAGRLNGVSYRLRGRHPDPDVIDNVLADRIRSELGVIEKRLDLPHIHVMVENHLAVLHGEVGSERDADELEQAVATVSGVLGVESYLHVGLTPGDTRPSAGRGVHPPSEALRRLLDAAIAAGTDPQVAGPVVRGILATFAERIPPGEREQVATHLPGDVRPLFSPPRRDQPVARPRTLPQLVARIAGATAELPLARAEAITAEVIRVFRTLVPEEATDVAAVLPAELRRLWLGELTV